MRSHLFSLIPCLGAGFVLFTTSPARAVELPISHTFDPAGVHEASGAVGPFQSYFTLTAESSHSIGSVVSSANEPFGPIRWSGVADTNALTVQTVSASGIPDFHPNLTYDLGAVSYLVDPLGFDPPKTITFNLSFAASFSLSTSFFPPLPIDPISLATVERTNVIRLVLGATLTALVDGQPVLSTFTNTESGGDLGLKIFFSQLPAPAVSSVIEVDDNCVAYAFNQCGPYSFLSIDEIISRAFNATTISQVDGNEFREMTAHGWVSQIPEPSTALLLTSGLFGLAATRRRRA